MDAKSYWNVAHGSKCTAGRSWKFVQIRILLASAMTRRQKPSPKKSLPRTMTSRAGTLCPPTSKHHRHHHGLSMLGSQGSAPRQIAAALSRPDPIATGKFLEPLLVFPVQVYLSSSIPLQLVTASSEQLQRSDRPHTFPPPSMVPRRWARYAV